MSVPNQVHFAFTTPRKDTGVPFSLVHFLAVASAYRYARPEGITLHTLHEHSGFWWDRAAELCDIQIELVPEARFNAHFTHPAHQADAIRLDTLDHDGGIFLDLDIITLRSFEPLLGTTPGVTMGWEDDLAVCPAVILAEPGSLFVREWIRGYDPSTSDWKGFRSRGRDEYWGEISTRYPLYLAQRLPESVELLPANAFYPVHWRRKDCERLFLTKRLGGLTLDELKDAYTLHLWQSGTWSHHLSCLTVESIVTSETVLASLLRPLLEGVPPCP